jgi:Rad3-related DNA helicase/REP element-mobilizing transposase RayT
MPTAVGDILGPGGAIARRLGKGYEPRAQQLEMATAVERALSQDKHLVVEAGTGVGKSFAYLVPAIDYVLRTKKRVVISTHTISLQEQLVDKDIPLLQSVYPDEFSAVLVKGRGNYLCHRRLDQARARQNMLFDNDLQLEALWQIEEWAQDTHDGSLASLPMLPEMAVWEKVNAEAGNCLGKRCNYFDKCHWQAAKRRMQSGQLLIVNHALFFSDLALKMAGATYLPKYDAVIFDEAHTLEDVAGQHFGIRLSEAAVRYQLRTLYDRRRGSGILSTHGSSANAAIGCVLELHDEAELFFDRIAHWQEKFGRPNGRVHEPVDVPNDLTPRLNDLVKFLKEMIAKLGEDEAAVSELGSLAMKVGGMADTIDAVMRQSMPDAVYWFELTGRTPRRVSLHAAPIDVAEGLRTQLFEKITRVVLTSATLATGEKGQSTQRGASPRGTGASPVQPREGIRRGAYLPHLTQRNGIYTVTFRLADTLPRHVVSSKAADSKARNALDMFVANFDDALDAGNGNCWLKDSAVAQLVTDTIERFNGERYKVIAWSIMPNHVHLILQPIGIHELPDIIHSIKSWTAKEANRILSRSGEFWQSEYYDHLIRDPNDLYAQVDYVWNNPAKANLEDWKWRGRDDDVLALMVGFVMDEHGRGARATGNAATRDDRATDEFAQAATLPEKTDPRFAFITRRLGIDRAETLHLGSPFDYASQATLYIENGLPDPADALRFAPAAAEKVMHYLEQTHGGAFVLFTSYKALLEMANLLKSRIEALGLPLLVQGQNAPRKVLLDRFRSLDNAVLFGTSSFWQGIDVQGDKLRNVIIVKLPFAVPDEPLTEAKLEAIRRGGGNPFMDLSVPEAVIKLKQGFGRLIRSKTDRGIVVILDGRVRSRRYGQLFLDALPACKTVDVRG